MSVSFAPIFGIPVNTRCARMLYGMFTVLCVYVRALYRALCVPPQMELKAIPLVSAALANPNPFEVYRAEVVLQSAREKVRLWSFAGLQGEQCCLEPSLGAVTAPLHVAGFLGKLYLQFPHF